MVEEDDSDEEDGIPIMALFSPETEINHLKQGPRWVKLETGGFRSCRVRCCSADGTMAAKTGVRGIQAGPDLSVGMVTSEGNWAQATFQVAEVTRPLCSVSKMCDKGNRVVF